MEWLTSVGLADMWNLPHQEGAPGYRDPAIPRAGPGLYLSRHRCGHELRLLRQRRLPLLRQLLQHQAVAPHQRRSAHRIYR